MLVKRYISKDMHEAMSTVIGELGPDAVILNNRKVRQKGLAGWFKKRRMEVMVAYDPNKIPSAKRFNGEAAPQPRTEKKAEAPALPDQTGQAEAPAGESVPEVAGTNEPVTTEQMTLLDRRIDSLDHMLRDFMEKFSFVKRDITYDYPEKVEKLFCSMLENQVRDELAHSIARQTDAILKRQSDADAAEVMQHLLLEQLGSPDPIVHKKFTRKTVLVMGPTGAGKTTSIVKLAANFAIKQKKKVGIINTDTYRVGAQE
jgi:flagellar biosynthesis protein FlhF